MPVYDVQEVHKENMVAFYRSQVEGSHCEGFFSYRRCLPEASCV